MSRGPNMKEKMKSKTEASVCSEVTMVPRVEGKIGDVVEVILGN